MKNVFPFIVLLVTTASASGQGQDKVNIRFSTTLAADTLRALEAIEVCIKNNPNEKDQCHMNKGFEDTLLCATRMRCDIRRPPNGTLQIEREDFEDWKEHLTSQRGKFIDDHLRYRLCDGLRSVSPDNNVALSEKEKKEEEERNKRKEAPCLGRRRAQ